MMRYYSSEHNRFINFDATGKMKDGSPVLKGIDVVGTEYEAVGIENVNRTLIAATAITIKKESE